MRSDREKSLEAVTILESLALPGFSLKACRKAIRRAQRSAKPGIELAELKILEEWLDDVSLFFRD